MTLDQTSGEAAVMQRRHEPPGSLDFFPTPPWATRALLEYVIVSHKLWSPGLLVRGDQDEALDPACGEQHIHLVLSEYFNTAAPSDIFQYGNNIIRDFVHPDVPFDCSTDWVITNPPFNIAVPFIINALAVARKGVAMLVRTSFLEGEKRFDELFAEHPPHIIAQFSERVPMHRGRWVVDGSTATSYCWLVWKKTKANSVVSETAPRFVWFPKSRKILSRHDDWLRFCGCVDVPQKHAAALELARIEASKVHSDRLTVEQVLRLRG